MIIMIIVSVAIVVIVYVLAEIQAWQQLCGENWSSRK